MQIFLCNLLCSDYIATKIIIANFYKSIAAHFRFKGFLLIQSTDSVTLTTGELNNCFFVSTR